MNKNNVNNLSRFPKNKILNTKKLIEISRQGTRIGEDKEKSVSTIMQKHDYTNLAKQEKYLRMQLKYLKIQLCKRIIMKIKMLN